MWLLAPVVFYPMLWLRPLFMFAAKILGGLSLLAALGGACFNLSSPDTAHRDWFPALTSGALAFGLFLLREFYDRVLFRLNPTCQTLILFK